MKILQKITDYKKFYNERLKNTRIGFVPTMGALHEGHLSLLKKCKQENEATVLSIFVNPIQFGKNEDLAKYPRTFDEDVVLAEKIGVDVIFCPSKEEMYSVEQKVFIEPDFRDKLCAKSRPNHFKGVLTVVAKLFNIIHPQKAYFGQKDYQQFLLIKKMVEQLNFDIKIKMCPIIRENDGLAMSSRNKYLSQAEREDAVCLSESLKKAEEILLAKKFSVNEIKKEMQRILSQNKFFVEKKIDYIFIGNAENLDEFESETEIFSELKRKNELKILAAIAVYIGKTRLIDNKIINISL